MAERIKIFIAYCFPEKRWLDRVQAALEPFAGSDRCVVWDERKLRTGVAWKEELPDVLATTKVAMMIVSDLFLESEFITRARLPALLEREREHGLEICWVLASHCLFELAGLKESDAGNRVGSAFDGLGLAQRDAEVAAIAKKVAAYLGVEAPLATGQPAVKKPLLPSAIPQIVEPKPVRKKKRSFGTRPAEPEPTLPLPSSPPADAEPEVAQLPAASPEPEPDAVAKTAELPPPEPAAPKEIVAPAEPAAVEPPPPLSARALSLETMIQTRQASVLKLSRLARWLLFIAIAAAVASVAVLLAKSFMHFLFVAGFPLFVAGLALRLHARALFLGQGLVGMRYTGNGLADDALPTRQREVLVRKADEYLAQN